MINGKTVLAIIPARGGSKGVPRKNVRDIAGKPLIAWTIDEAKKSKYIDRLILSSEDEEIISVARSWGCQVPFIRPKELAKDDTPGIEPVVDAINRLEESYDYIILLQPTSPLRTVEDIDSSLELCLQQDASTCVSVSEVDKSPYWTFRLNEDGTLNPIMDKALNVPRQKLQKFYSLNGAIYISKIKNLLETKNFLNEATISHLMPKERSIDIDTEIDFKLAEFIFEQSK